MITLSSEARRLYDMYLSIYLVESGEFKKLPRGRQLPAFELLENVSSQSTMSPPRLVESVSFETAEEIFNFLPKKAQHFLKECGKAQKSGWYNHEIGECDPPGTKSTSSRGILLLQKYLGQGGRCQYTGLSCEGPGYMVVDHIIELGEGTDAPSNWALVNAELNSWKKNKNFEQLVEAAKKVVLRGRTEWQQKKGESSKNTAARKEAKQRIKSMSLPELRQEWERLLDPAVPNSSKQREYIGRRINIKALGTSRKKVNGEKRTGGCERNYTAVLNTYIQVFLFDSPDKARRLYELSRSTDKRYIAGDVSLATLLECHASNVEQCRGHIWKEGNWDSDKWIATQLKRRPNG